MGGRAAGEKRVNITADFIKGGRLLLEKCWFIAKLTWAAVPWEDWDDEYPALPVWLVVLEFRVWPSSPGMSANWKSGFEDVHKVRQSKTKIHAIFVQVKFVPAIVSVWRGLVEGAVPPLRNSCDFESLEKNALNTWRRGVFMVHGVNTSMQNKIYLGGEIGSNERGDSLSKEGKDPRSSSPGNRIGWNGFKLNVEHLVHLWCHVKISCVVCTRYTVHCTWVRVSGLENTKSPSLERQTFNTCQHI